MSAGRLILPHVHLMKQIKNGAHVTGVLFPFLVEHMVAAGALEIIVTDAWRYRDTFQQIPEHTRNYIKLSDVGVRADTISRSFFGSIFHELGINFEGGSYSSNVSGALDMYFAPIKAHSSMSQFIEGFLLRAHIHFDMKEFTANLTATLSFLRVPENRLKLQSFISALAVYDHREMPTAHVIKAPTTNRELRLRELLLTEEYRALSAAHGRLGALTNPHHIRDRIGALVRKFVALDPTKSVLDYGSKAASVAAGVPVPDSKLVESFVTERFLPTALDLSREIEMSINQFKQYDPESYDNLAFRNDRPFVT